MKVVIQCSSSKSKRAGSFTLSGRHVKFVAHPELHTDLNGKTALFRPDDLNPTTLITWRDHLLVYNQRSENPGLLLQAVNLYAPEIYRRLLQHVGVGNLFILSAGWGLIKADFLVPDYDITFSFQAEPWKRRTKDDEFHDFVQLAQGDITAGEQVYFFGGKDYLPLYYSVIKNLVARKVIYFTSNHIPRENGFEYIHYGFRGTNWHYRCAKDFIEGRISM